jgi:hypothetical protein
MKNYTFAFCCNILVVALVFGFLAAWRFWDLPGWATGCLVVCSLLFFRISDGKESKNA